MLKKIETLIFRLLFSPLWLICCILVGIICILYILKGRTEDLSEATKTDLLEYWRL